MKKMLIVACLVVALGAGCKKPAPKDNQPAQPTTAAGQTAPAQPAAAPGQTAPAQPAVAPGQTAAADPADKARCDLLQKEYFTVQIDRIRVIVDYKAKMLEVYKKAGKSTPEVNVEVGRLAQEMQSKLEGVMTAHGFKSSADLNPQGCPGFQPAAQDPKMAAEFEEMAKKIAEMDKEIIGYSNPEGAAAPTPPAPPAPPPTTTP